MQRKIVLLLVCFVGIGVLGASTSVRGRWAGDDAKAKCSRDCRAKCEAYCSIRGGVVKHMCTGHVGSDDEHYANCECRCVE